MTSLIIPAHNEAETIGHTLATLLAGFDEDEIEVIVSCNGCSDGTEDVVRERFPGVHVVTTSVASKTAALNLAENHAKSFPRIYMDADVSMTRCDVLALVAALEGGDCLAAAPEARYDTSRSNGYVRSYMRLWLALPTVRDDLVGSGVYAVGEVGRSRFDEFPNVLNDDHFVRMLFDAGEKCVVHSAVSRVSAPRTLTELVRRKARVVRGNRGLHQMGRDGPSRGARGIGAALRSDRRLALDLPVYAVVSVIAHLRATWESLSGRRVSWGRDSVGRG